MPEVFDDIKAVRILYAEEGGSLYYTHVQESEQKCNLCIIVPGQENVGCQHEVPSLHPILECRL